MRHGKHHWSQGSPAAPGRESTPHQTSQRDSVGDCCSSRLAEYTTDTDAPPTPGDTQRAPGERLSAHQRAAFRRVLLSSGYMLRAVVDLLQDVRQGRRPIDRVVDVEHSAVAATDQLAELIVVNLPALDRYLAENERDFRFILHSSLAPDARRAIRRRMAERRRRAISLLEQSPPKIESLGAHLESLVEAAQRMTWLAFHLEEVQRKRVWQEHGVALRNELRDLECNAGEETAVLCRRVQRLQYLWTKYQRAKSPQSR